MPDGPGGFAQNFSCSALLRIPVCRNEASNTGLSPSAAPAFQPASSRLFHTMSRSCNPRGALPRHGFGLFPFRSPLHGESLVYFLFLQVLRCFSSLRSPPALEHAGCTARSRTGCPIRKSAGQWLFAPYRGLSQLITSFIASVSQGIRPAPFLTFANVCAFMIAHKGTDLLILSAVRNCFLFLNLYSFACINMSKIFCSLRLFLFRHRPQNRVENNGFEPLTPCLQSRCSSQLS